MAELDTAGRTPVSVRTWRQDGVQVISLTGELDLTNVEEVRTAIEPVLGRHDQKFIFEVGALTFMDSSGIALLVTVARQAREVELRDPTPVVRRLIEMTGLGKVLPMAP